MISDSLLFEMRNTKFLIGSEKVPLKIGEPFVCDKPFVLITANNPDSILTSRSTNLLLNSRLTSDVVDKYEICEYVSVPDRDCSFSEHGFVVYDMLEKDAIVLAKKYQQDAIVFCDLDQLPKLLITNE